MPSLLPKSSDQTKVSTSNRPPDYTIALTDATSSVSKVTRFVLQRLSEKFRITQLLKAFPDFIEHEVSSPCLQKPAFGL
jgi:hypothetical protein